MKPYAEWSDKDGIPSDTLPIAKQESLDNWHTLEKRAGFI